MKKAYKKIKAGTMVVYRSYEADLPNMLIDRCEIPLPEAQLAEQILLRMCLACGEVDGEDSAGRQKGRRLQAGEMVSMAFDISESYFKEARKRELIEAIPSPEEREDMLKEAENKN